MKKIGEYTCRGRLATATQDRILLFDGRFDTAYKVTSFEICSDSPVFDNTELVGKLMYRKHGGSTGDYQEFRWDDNNEIAWAFMEDTLYVRDFVDPDNLIVEDCYVSVYSGAGSGSVNYMIKFEKYDISEYKGVLSMVRASSQGEPSN